MSYAKQTTENKSFFKRFSHQKRFDVAVDLINSCRPQTVIDYGTGNGHLLKCLAITLPETELIGYDPLDDMFQELKVNIESSGLTTIAIVKNLEELNGQTFDLVSCQEVLEHFNEDNQAQHLMHLKALLKEDGKLVISVPLEIGLTALFKNIVRIAAKQKHGLTSAKNILKSIFGLKIERNNNGYINSHIGFNYKELEVLFESENLNIIRKQFSPFNPLRSALNSQIFYILEKKKAS